MRGRAEVPPVRDRETVECPLGADASGAREADAILIEASIRM